MPPPLARSAEETSEFPVPPQDASAANQEPSEQRQRLVHLEKAVAQTEKRLGRLSKTSLAGVTLRSTFLNTLRPTQGVASEDQEVSSNTNSIVGLTAVTRRTSLESTHGDLWPSNALSRIEALEANTDDLRRGMQDALAVAESTETLLKAAMDHEVEQLWRELRLLRMQSIAEMQRVEKSGAEALQRAQEAEQQVQAVHQEQVHKLVEDITLRVQDLEQQRHKQAAEVAVVQLRLQGVERTHKQQHADNGSQPEEAIHLKVQDLEQQLQRQAAEV